MNKQEFSALQVMVLVRTQPDGGQAVREYLDSVSFQYELQDTLGNLMKEKLSLADVDFNEVIISLDAPAQKARKIRKKSSFVGRLFGDNER